MAFGQATFNDFGGAVGDLFAAEGHRYKAKGAQFEKTNYENAAKLADQNAIYTENSTKIKLAQQDRDLFKSLGRTTADIAGAGFSQSGSALDILREGAQQGALTKAVANEQGVIQQDAYKQQAESYRNMAQAAQAAIDAENSAALGSDIMGGIKMAAGFATFL